MSDYVDYVARKLRAPAFPAVLDGPVVLPGDLFGFQRALVRWALRKGRAAIFADTGLGKTAMQLAWARIVAESHGRVLILAPLAVAQQTVRESARWGAPASYLRDDDGRSRVVVTNYEMLGRFEPAAFRGVVLDESSILKAYDGRTRTAIIDAFARTPFRLACTATPAPNDYTELGNHAEFLGVQTRAEMLSEFFVHDGGRTSDWRLKGHAVTPFWRWVATWGAVVRSPADLGYDGEAERYRLPLLREHDHPIAVDTEPGSGMLWATAARTLAEQRAVRKATIPQRIARVVEIVTADDAPAVVWCSLNAESEAAAAAIPGAVEVTGAMSLEEKERRLVDFAEGRARVLVSKPRICGHGLNWQHCARVVFAGPSHSYEQTYQAIRRCWRFGQTRPVDVHTVYAETEGAVLTNYRAKERAADAMAQEMIAHVGAAVRAEVTGATARDWNAYEAAQTLRVPGWLKGEAA